MIIKKRLGLDIMVKTRSREYVDARIIYSKILKEHGYTLSVIGNSIMRDHTVIVHYLQTANALIKNDDNFYMNLVSCRNEFNVGKLDSSGVEKLRQLQDALYKITKDYELEKKKNASTKKIIDKYDRFCTLIDYLDRIIPEGDESFAIKKLMRALNN